MTVDRRVSANWGGSANRLTTAEALAAAEWTHLAGTHDGQTMSLFRDGALQETADNGDWDAFAGMAAAVTIGYRDHPTPHALVGSLDEVRIMNRALTPAELLSTVPTQWALGEVQ